MKKAVSLGLSAALILTAFTGCKAPASGGDGSGGTQNKVLKVAALESAYGAEMWQEIKKAFEAANEGVTVELTVSKTLEDEISPQMKAGNYPDVVHLAGGPRRGSYGNHDQGERSAGPERYAEYDGARRKAKR